LYPCAQGGHGPGPPVQAVSFVKSWYASKTGQDSI
jgi:hypothetical protein